MSASSSTVPAIEPKKVVFGIDLGTLRSRVVVLQKNEDGILEAQAGVEIPSVVSFTKKYHLCIVGSDAEERTIASAPNTFRLTKCLIGRQYNDPEVQEFIQKKVGFEVFQSPNGHAHVVSTNFHRILTPSQIAALILLKLKEFCLYEFDVPMKNVVITTPAYFTDAQLEATKEAAQLAGLNVLKMIDEPTAVGVAYRRNATESKTVVVYDFGGTFKVSVLEIRNGKFEVKSTVSDLFLGGDNFDDVLIDYFVTELKRVIKFDVTEDILIMQKLRKTAEYAKIDLSYCTEISVKFYILRLNEADDCISLKLTRTKFEQLVEKFIDKTKPLCHRVLEDAKVSVSDIDEVFAVGGISWIPKVRATLQEIFGKAPHRSKICGLTKAVVVGAAHVGRTLATDITENNEASVEISPHLPNSAKENTNFDFKICDDPDKMCLPAITIKDFSGKGILDMLTEEEADRRILKELKSLNRIDDGDVKFIKDHQELISLRRRKPELQLPHDIQKIMDFFKNGRDNFVKDHIQYCLPPLPGSTRS